MPWGLTGTSFQKHVHNYLYQGRAVLFGNVPRGIISDTHTFVPGKREGFYKASFCAAIGAFAAKQRYLKTVIFRFYR